MRLAFTFIVFVLVTLTINHCEASPKNWMEPGEDARMMDCMRESVTCRQDGTDVLVCYNQHVLCMDLEFPLKTQAMNKFQKLGNFKTCFKSLESCVKSAADDTKVNACAEDMKNCIAQGQSDANILTNLPATIQRVILKYIKCKTRESGDQRMMANCVRRHIASVRKMGKMQLHRSCFQQLKMCSPSTSVLARSCFEKYHGCLGS